MTAPTTTTTLETWTIDASHTHVGFAVRHMMVATAKGTFADVKGTVEFDGANLATAKINVEIAAASIDTKTADRDNHLRSPDFFDAAGHPTITFVSKKITPTDGNEFTIVGDLTIRGTTKEITLAAESHGSLRDPWGLDRAGFSASGKINRLDYGLNWNAALETGGFVVAQDVKITLDVEITKPGN
ncbi:MAG TPA: YceI family protein [Gemmatimonadaceae bacterium]|jgi:polyisoprenoid-binding protein YceI|nr:YceI family protein [Gemmatimonadaceae bacterium]